MIWLFIFFCIGASIFASHGMKWYENYPTPFWKPNGFFVGQFWALIYLSTILFWLLVYPTVLNLILVIVLGGIFLLQSFSFFVRKRMILSIMVSFLSTLVLAMVIFFEMSSVNYELIFLAPLAIWNVFQIILSRSIRSYDNEMRESQ